MITCHVAICVLQNTARTFTGVRVGPRPNAGHDATGVASRPFIMGGGDLWAGFYLFVAGQLGAKGRPNLKP